MHTSLPGTAREMSAAGIHAAGQAQQHLFIAHLSADGIGLPLDVVGHIVVARRAAHVIYEIFQDFLAVRGVLHFGVKLHAVELARGVLKCRHGAVFGVRRGREPFGQAADVIGVAHKRGFRFVEIVKEGAGVFDMHLHLPVFAHFAGGNGAAEGVRHKLHPVADAEDGDAEAENFPVARGRAFFVNAVRPAREHDADGGEFSEFLRARRAGQDDGMHVRFADPARDEFLVLSAEIEHDDGLIFFHIFLRNK